MATVLAPGCALDRDAFVAVATPTRTPGEGALFVKARRATPTPDTIHGGLPESALYGPLSSPRLRTGTRRFPRTLRGFPRSVINKAVAPFS